MDQPIGTTQTRFVGSCDLETTTARGEIGTATLCVVRPAAHPDGPRYLVTAEWADCRPDRVYYDGPDAEAARRRMRKAMARVWCDSDL